MRYIAPCFTAFLVLTTLSSYIFNEESHFLNINAPGAEDSSQKTSTVPQTVGDISLPAGFSRKTTGSESFASWLRQIKLKRDKTVYLYNGSPAERQDMQYAVMDISTGNRDLQQCADAIMRLKAEYYFSRRQFNDISFPDGDGKNYNFKAYAEKKNDDTHDCLMHFLETVFINCGTYTIDAMTRAVRMQELEAGDVFVKAGAPGHAMIVADVAVNAAGEKIYLLAQGYMPAQDMHIVIDPADSTLSPWFKVMSEEKIVTPGWIFLNTQLKRFK